jgi:hypothetical protein
MNRSCQRQTVGFATPACRATAIVPTPSPLKRIIRAPPDVLLRAARRRDDRFEASTVPSADFDLDLRSHPAILARIAANENLLLVTNQ